MRKSNLKLLAAFSVAAFIAVALASCATLNMANWTPKQKADYFMRVYLSQAKATDAVLKDPAATPEKKAAAEKNKATLAKVYPLIKAYADYVESGNVPLPTDEDQINALLDQLIDLL
jgi:hypothetical protein